MTVPIRRRALLISSSYPADRSGETAPTEWSPLPFAKERTSELVDALTRLGYECEILLGPPTELVTQRVRAAIGEVGPEDVLLIHVLGHGYLSDRTGRLYLGAAETPGADLTGWPLLVEDAAHAPATLMLLDLDHAGAVVDAFDRTPTGSRAYRKVWIVAGCAANEMAYGGAFTSAVTASLRDIAGGTMDLDPLRPYVPLPTVVRQVARHLDRAAKAAGGFPQRLVSTSVDITETVTPAFFANPLFQPGAEPSHIEVGVDPLQEPGPPRPARQYAGFSADTTGGVDRLGFTADVDVLCDMIMAEEIKPPLSIGLFGDWGTGKSFFMRKMQARIAQLADLSTRARVEGQGSAYCASVCQVEFNAWHYVDANLWASLTGTILNRLADDLDTAAIGHALRDLPSIRNRRDELRIERDEVRHRLDEATQDLATAEPIGLREALTVDVVTERAKAEVGQALAKAGVPAEGVDLREAAGDLASTVGRFWFLMRRGRWSTRLVLAVLVAIVVLAPTAALTWLHGVLAVPAAALAPALLALLGLRRMVDRVKPALKLAEDVVRRVDERREEPIRARRESLRRLIERYEDEIRTVDARIKTLDRADSLRAFAADRRGCDDYRRHEGLVAVVRRDLEELSNRLANAPDIERIVLYIDDLDRCPPARVVEVLQAVNLLLAFRLFVVVVGADARWLIRSLQRHYREVLGSPDAGGEADHWASTPQNYLEKIFQLSINLRPMSDVAYRDLLCDELVLDVEDDAIGDGGPTTNGKAVAPSPQPQPSTPSPRRADVPANAALVEPRLIRMYAMTAGAVALGFTATGIHLVAQLVDGTLTCWDTRIRHSVGRSAQLSPGPVDAAVVASTGHVLAASARQLYLAHGVEQVSLGSRPISGPPASGPVRVALAPDGTRGAVSWWADGQQVAQLRRPDGAAPTVEAATAVPGTVVLLAPDWQLVQAGDDTVLARAPREGRTLVKHQHEARSATTDPQATTLATVDRLGTLRLWRVADDIELTVSPVELEPGNTLAAVRTAAISGTDLLAVIRGDEVLAWDLNQRRLVTRFTTPDSASQLAFSPDGRRLAVGLAQGSIAVYAIAEPDVPDLSARTLQLTRSERQSLVDMRPLISTPRSAKRLVNTYRLLRAGLTDEQLRRLRASDQTAVILLTAVLVGHPVQAPALLDELAAGTDEQSLGKLLARAHPRLHAAVRLVQDATPIPDGLTAYRRWASTVARFSFRTGHLVTPADPATRSDS